MSLYIILKIVHIIGSTYLFGAGTATALLIYRSYLLHRKGKIGKSELGFALNHAVHTDWFFTLLAGIIQLITGVSLSLITGIPLLGGWLLEAWILFFCVALFWSLAAYLQLQMQRVLREKSDLDMEVGYRKLIRYWVLPGIPSFVFMILIFYLMVAKMPLIL